MLWMNVGSVHEVCRHESWLQKPNSQTGAQITIPCQHQIRFHNYQIIVYHKITGSGEQGEKRTFLVQYDRFNYYE